MSATENMKPECRHLWIRFGDLQKCENCGHVREAPDVRQREAQESVVLNRSMRTEVQR